MIDKRVTSKDEREERRENKLNNREIIKDERNGKYRENEERLRVFLYLDVLLAFSHGVSIRCRAGDLIKMLLGLSQPLSEFTVAFPVQLMLSSKLFPFVSRLLLLGIIMH